MTDHHKQCRKALRLARAACEGENIHPVSCESEKLGDRQYRVYTAGTRKLVNTCCAWRARAQEINNYYKEYSEYVLIPLGSKLIPSNKQGMKYVDDCLLHDKRINPGKLLKIKDETAIMRLHKERNEKKVTEVINSIMRQREDEKIDELLRRLDF